SSKVVIGTDGYLFYRDSIEFAKGVGLLSPRLQQTRRATHFPLDDVFGRKLMSFLTRTYIPRPIYPVVGTDDAVTAFIDMRAQLEERGIRLIVMRILGKDTIYPENLSPAYPPDAGPALNSDYRRWKEQLNAAGVEVLDVTDLLWQAKSAASESLYLKYD